MALWQHVEEVRGLAEAIAVLVGIGISVLTFSLTRRKAAATLNEQQAKLRTELLAQIDALTEQSAKLQSRFIEMQNRIMQLEQKNMNLLHRIVKLEMDKAELQRRVQALELEREALWRGITILVKQIRESGLEPAWEPPQDHHHFPPFTSI